MNTTLTSGQKSAKLCPNCRAILNPGVAVCHCGFQFFKAKAAPMETFCGTCVQIGGAVFALAFLTAVVLRFL